MTSRVTVSTAATEPMSMACVIGSLRTVGEEKHEDEDHPGGHEQDQPERVRDHVRCAVDPVAPRLFAIGGLIEPLGERGLLGSGLWVSCLQRPEQRDAPRIERFPGGAGLHFWPLLVHDRARVAHELTRDALADRGGKELSGLELLDDDKGFALSPVARLIVGREGEEDDEAREDRIAGGQHSEDACGPVPVLKVAPFGCASTDEEHARDRDGGHGHGDEDRPDDVHRGVQR